MSLHGATFDRCQRQYDTMTPDEPDECPLCGCYMDSDECPECDYKHDRDYDPTNEYDGILGEG